MGERGEEGSIRLTNHPQVHPQARQVHRVARTTLMAGIVIMGMKFAVFAVTGSAAVLTDAIESIVNIVAAGVMLYSVWFSNRPADEDHPYGHGKMEFLTLGFEGAMILIAGVAIGAVAITRLIQPVALEKLDLGLWMLLGVNLCSAGLAGWVYYCGRKYKSMVLVADAKHLLTDVISTVGGMVALWLVQMTGVLWIDPLIAIVLTAFIFLTSWKLLRQSADGLLDRIDAKDQAAIECILNDEVAGGRIISYHKVRHRHAGDFHWVDMHLQVNGDLTVRDGHEIASRIEYRIEQALGRAKATAHIEPQEPITFPENEPGDVIRNKQGNAGL